MKKIILVFMTFLGLSACLSANDFKKSAGIDISVNGMEPNFYMHSENLEFQCGLSFTLDDLITNTYSLKPKAEIGYCTNIGNSDFRFGIGFADTLMFCFESDYFSVGDLFGMYVNIAKPLDSRLELAGKVCLPLVYTNIGTDPARNNILFPCGTLFAYTFTTAALEIRFYFD